MRLQAGKRGEDVFLEVSRQRGAEGLSFRGTQCVTVPWAHGLRFRWAFEGGTRRPKFTSAPRPPFCDDSVLLPGRFAHTPPHFGEETHLLFVLWSASHSAMALGSRRDEKAANEEGGALAQKTSERPDPWGKSGSMLEAETLIRPELRPLHACPVRTRTRHPGAAAGCAGAESGAWSPRGAWSAAHCAQRSAAPLAARARVGSWCCRGHRLHRRCLLLLRRRRPAAHSLPRQRVAFPKWLPLPGPW